MAPGRTKRHEASQPQATSLYPPTYISDPNSSHNHHPKSRPMHHHRQVSEMDFDSDIGTATALQTHDGQLHSTPRTNEELNLSVLQRHYPEVVDVLSIAPYAVIYTFSATAERWEKAGTEGTLFVCQLAQPEDQDGNVLADEPEERYAVIVLNRRGLENFELELKSADEVEVTDEYVILQGHIGDGMGIIDGSQASYPTPIIYGLWIFTEPPPSSTAEAREVNARVIQDCASRAEASRRAVEERRILQEQQDQEARGAPYQQMQDANNMGVAMARQLSLRELFEQQRVQDSSFGVHRPHRMHEPSAMPTESAAYWAEPSADVLGDLFRRARQDYQSNG